MKKITQKEIDSVLRLEVSKRFDYFVKWVADGEAAWGLWDGGWALLSDDDGGQLLPLWPAREYAELCRIDNWSAYEVQAIPIDDLLTEVAEKLTENKVRPAVFPTPHGRAVVTTVESLCAALRRELERYE